MPLLLDEGVQVRPNADGTYSVLIASNAPLEYHLDAMNPEFIKANPQMRIQHTALTEEQILIKALREEEEAEARRIRLAERVETNTWDSLAPTFLDSAKQTEEKFEDRLESLEYKYGKSAKDVLEEYVKEKSEYMVDLHKRLGRYDPERPTLYEFIYEGKIKVKTYSYIFLIVGSLVGVFVIIALLRKKRGKKER